MALAFHKDAIIDTADVEESIVLDRPLFLNAAQDKVVEADDPDAAFVYGTVGVVKRRSEALRLGYKSLDDLKAKEAKKPDDPKPEEEKKAPSPANKQAPKPADK